MDILSFILALTSCLLLIPTLALGALSDYRTRTFPKEFWDCTTVKIAIAATAFMYLSLLVQSEFDVVVTYIAISIIFALLFYFLALRFGSGGDYRALWHIALITPIVAIPTTVLSMVFGMIQWIVAVASGKKLNYKVPWAVGILLAFCVSIAYCIISSL